jgi:hypothetical protein
MFTINEVVCPKCGSPEMHPTMDKLLIRAHKVHDGNSWLSECLVCADYYDARLIETPHLYAPADKHWFRS